MAHVWDSALGKVVWKAPTNGMFQYEQLWVKETEAKEAKPGDPRKKAPFTAFLEPPGRSLEAYKKGRPASEQPASVPQTFLDAMEVRDKVFVKEQGVPMEHEFDKDDAKSCHWVVYASVCTVIQQEVRDDDGNVIVPRKSEGRGIPIGTIRLVPFPHDPHPIKGAKYWDGKTEEEIAGKDVKKPEKTCLGYHTDRRTSFHDGHEPYYKLGRLAVDPEYRNNGIGRILIAAAERWMEANPSHWDPSVRTKGFERLNALDTSVVPAWKGLICVHAQEKVVEAWKKWGFEVDEEMGSWEEEGIPHVGMWKRLDVKKPMTRISNHEMTYS